MTKQEILSYFSNEFLLFFNKIIIWVLTKKI
jgi:hypothetical protein